MSRGLAGREVSYALYTGPRPPLAATSAAFNFEGVVRGHVSRRGETYGEQEGALVVVADAVGTVDSVGGHFGY